MGYCKNLCQFCAVWKSSDINKRVGTILLFHFGIPLSRGEDSLNRLNNKKRDAVITKMHLLSNIDPMWAFHRQDLLKEHLLEVFSVSSNSHNEIKSALKSDKFEIYLSTHLKNCIFAEDLALPWLRGRNCMMPAFHAKW